jgi:hypothetical protein
MRIKRKSDQIKRQATEYYGFGRAYAIAYRYGKWGRTFAVQCPHCENFLESPFRPGHRWEIQDFIIRRRIHCPICALDLQVSAKYIIIEEDEEDKDNVDCSRSNAAKNSRGTDVYSSGKSRQQLNNRTSGRKRS